MAVDAVMVVDSAKGTRPKPKLFRSCQTPWGSCLHLHEQLDRDGREPLDLLEELEEGLGIASYPMNWLSVWVKSSKDFLRLLITNA